MSVDDTSIYQNPQGQCFTVSSTVAQMAIGEFISCARLASGIVMCWGYNSRGQIGVNDMSTFFFPVPGEQVLGLNAVDVVSGAYHACAIPSGAPRLVVCWGNDLLQPTAVDMNIPANITVSRLGAGVHAYSTCAIMSDGSLQCWIATTVPLTATPVVATW